MWSEIRRSFRYLLGAPMIGVAVMILLMMLIFATVSLIDGRVELVEVLLTVPEAMVIAIMGSVYLVLPAAYLVGFPLGLVAHVVLHSCGRTSATSYRLAGAGCGAATALAAFHMLLPVRDELFPVAASPFLIAGMLAGAASGYIFWYMAVREAPEKAARSSPTA
jgi:hypothetical protein